MRRMRWAFASIQRGIHADARVTAAAGIAELTARVLVLGLGGLLVVRGELTVGSLLAFLGYVAGESIATDTNKCSLKPLRRGDYRFGPCHLRYTGVLGMVRRQHRFPIDAPVKVYPNLMEVRKYELLARRDQLFEIGLKNARRLGEGTEFERLRDYEKDDDYRRIYWPATAKLHRPITMDYQPERSQSVIVLLDAGRLMTAPLGPLSKLDYAINTTLLLAYVAIVRGDRVGLLTFADNVTGYFEPDRGRRQFLALLEALYKVQPQQVESDYLKASAFLSTPSEELLRIDARPPPGDPLAESLGSEADVGLLVIHPATRRRMRVNGRAHPREPNGLEIATREGGFGLDPLLRSRRDDLVGILNGIDTDAWNPAADPAMVACSELGTRTKTRATSCTRSDAVVSTARTSRSVMSRARRWSTRSAPLTRSRASSAPCGR